jgi:EAL domain-containing protein (putative c-di-GMP-specific phosphodiesterase class I)
MWVYDLETLRFLEVNSGAVDHYGYTREEFLAMSITDIRPLRSNDFLFTVADALERSHFNPQNLILEITESVLIDDPETIIARLNSLKEIGVRLAIDDFGTGYSSLSYLRQLPFDILKIESTSPSSHPSPTPARP